MTYTICRKCGGFIPPEEEGLCSHFTGAVCECPKEEPIFAQSGVEFVWQQDVRNLTKAIKDLTDVLRGHKKPLFDSVEDYVASEMAKADEEG